MSEQIISVIDALCRKFGIVVDWTAENVLPYLQELGARYIKYEIATSIAWIVLIGALFIVALVLATRFHKKAHEIEYDDNYAITYAAIISWILCISFGISLVVVLCVQTLDIITCLTFPEKMFFDFVKQYLG